MKDTLSKKIIKIKSLVKEGIDIDENVKTTNEGVEKLEHLLHVFTLSCTIDTIPLSENSTEVVVHIARHATFELPFETR